MESIASWVAPVATTIAALMTASNLGARVTGWGFAVFLVGSIAWAALGAASGQPNLVWQNIILSVLNIFGIWRWLGRQRQFEKGGEGAAEASEHEASESLFPASDLSSAPVFGNCGVSLGKSIDAMIGCNSGRVTYAVVAEGGVGGVGEVLRRLDWRHVRKEEGGFVVTLDEPAFSRLPTIERDHWPSR